jgi:hypothetical protein
MSPELDIIWVRYWTSMLKQSKKNVARHHQLRAEATNIRVMLDMMRSHLSGEHLLSEKTSAYIFGGLALVGTMTGLAIAAQPISILLLDAVVVSFTIAALHAEIQEYVIWRSTRDPSYEPIKRELYGNSNTA